MKAISIFVLSVTMSLSAVVEAAPSATTKWSTIGSGCVVDTASTSKADVSQPNHSISFAGSNTGYIHITCPITGFQATSATGDNPNNMSIIYYDTDGTTDGCWLYGYLYRENYTSTAGLNTIASYIGYNDTSLSGSPNKEDTAVSHTFAFDNYIYYVAIDLYRDVTTCNVTFTGAGLNVPL